MSEVPRGRRARLEAALAPRPSRVAVGFLWSRRAHLAALRLEIARGRAQAACRRQLADQRRGHADHPADHPAGHPAGDPAGRPGAEPRSRSDGLDPGVGSRS